jgi:tetratricopeptide (TPR) repeat protein
VALPFYGRKDLKKLLIAMLFLCSLGVSAQVPKEFITLFQEEKYQEGLDFINAQEEKTLSRGRKEYLQALCYSRLRQYDVAIPLFQSAEALGHESIEFHYEYGQALYASNKLKEARFEFNTSAGKNYKYVPSLYYVAYISELLEDLVTAKGHYRRILKYKKTDRDMKQIAFYQYTKVLLKMMRREDRSQNLVKLEFTYLDVNLASYVPRYILPLLKKAVAVNPTSTVAGEINQTIAELVQEYKLDPDVLENGRRIHSKRYYANISVGYKSDNNVELTKKASSAYEYDLYGKYDFVLKKKVIVSPELRLISTKYTDKFEHTYKDRPASFLFDVEYTSGSEDWQASHNVEQFSTSTSFVVGEQVTLSDSGDSYFKIRKTDYTDKTELTNYKRLSFSFDQYTFFSDGGQLLVSTLDLSKISYENSYLSYDTYLLRLIHIFIEPFPTYSLQSVLTASLVNTKEQKDLRGMEFNFNPSIELTKNFTHRFRMSASLSYTSNKSKDENYKYSRRVFGTTLNYSF